MTRFSRQLALFLALVVLSNGLFAAQMTVTMISPKINPVNAITNDVKHNDGEEVAAAQPMSSMSSCHENVSSTSGYAVAIDDANENTKATQSSKVTQCCQGDCSGCLLGTYLAHVVKVDLPSASQRSEPMLTIKHVLPAHNSNLYRPPILI